ncbi:MAG TPA: tetratricopeptide repeat protein [Nitrospinaceae bacterium]|nr:tetratricopeptide repeat protein [Nitrospinaceae bacterium]
MGNTHYSIATVLTIFMAGLALGSYLGGRWIDGKKNPLFVYATLEGAIGIYCLLIPSIIDSAFPLFEWVYQTQNESYSKASLCRFFICGAILLIPTALMGATLPVLSKYVSRERACIGRDVGTLYSLNTFGAVFGALSSAFLFMRIWGVLATIWFAAGLNILIAVVIFILFRSDVNTTSKEELNQTKESIESSPLGSNVIFILLAFGFSGWCALTYQIAWNRILSLLLGSSIYAFSLILTTFILGLALGTMVFSHMVNKFKNPLVVFGFLQIGIGVSAIAMIPLFENIPFINRWVYQNWNMEFATIQWSVFLVIFCFLFVPTFFMGGQFPVVVRLVVRKLGTLGHSIGKVYASNTVGTIIGSFLAGFVLIPWIGVQNTILVAVGLNLLVGTIVLVFSADLTLNSKIYVLPAILVVCFLYGRSMETWDKSVISSGSYMPYRIGDLSEAEKKANKILFFKEGTHTTVTTELSVSGNIFLRVNGKTDASLAMDMRTQLLSGYLPMFLHGDPESVLVIGQGSGITLGAVEQFPIKSVDLVEISSAVIEGSRYFDSFNHNALSDKRLKVILADGRNHVALADQKYDVIISEPSNPWISGVGALFTDNFFKLMKKRLNPNGVACIWVHTNMSPMSFKSVARTFSENFKQVTMWESIVGDDYLIIGSDSEYKLSYSEVDEILSDEIRGKDLYRIGISNVRDLMSLLIMNREGLLRFSKDAPIHTDDNSLLEFNAPQYIYKDERDVLVRQLTPFIQIDGSLLEFGQLKEPNRLIVLKEIEAVERSESHVSEIKRRNRIDGLLDQAKEAYGAGDAGRAIDIYGKTLEQDPENILAWLNMGNVLKGLKRFGAAEIAYKRTLEINPFYLYGNIALAQLYLASKEPEKALDVLRPVRKWHSGDREVSLYMGLAFAFQKKAGLAIKEFQNAIRIDPEFDLPYYYTGVQYFNSHPNISKKNLKKFLVLSSENPESQNLVFKARQLLGKL